MGRSNSFSAFVSSCLKSKKLLFRATCFVRCVAHYYAIIAQIHGCLSFFTHTFFMTFLAGDHLKITATDALLYFIAASVFYNKVTRNFANGTSVFINLFYDDIKHCFSPPLVHTLLRRQEH